MDEVKDSITDLEDLLEAEVTALRSGDYVALEGLAVDKERLLRELAESQDDLDLEKTRDLQALLERNGVLYEATMDGLRTVIDRLKSVARVHSHLDTYAPGGAMQDLAPPQSSFEKRS